MTEARTPQDVRRDLIAIGKLLREVAEDYAWAFGFAFSPTSRHGYGEGGNTGKADEIAYSDPSGNVVADERKEAVRRVLETSSDDVADAVSALQRTRKRLRKRFGHGVWDLANLPEPEGGRIAKSEVIEHREAQQRRMARGKGFGDG